MVVAKDFGVPVKRKLEGDAWASFPKDRCLSEGLLYLWCQLSGGGKEILVCPLSLVGWGGDQLKFLGLKDVLGQGLSGHCQARNALWEPGLGPSILSLGSPGVVFAMGEEVAVYK